MFDFIFILGLLIVTIVGSIHLGKKEEPPIIGLLTLTGFILGTSLTYTWIFDYPVWPLWR